MRPLTLHVSALSDAEYTFYTSAISDLAVASGDDSQHNNAYYENLSVGVREARAWLRGRFSDLPVSDIDVVLKQFHPNLGHTDSLSGGQFFAALRLVVHVREGRSFDRTLAFVQANSVDLALSNSNSQPPHRQAHPPSSTSPPPPSSAAPPDTSTNPFQQPPSSAPPPYHQTSATPNANNPFVARAKSTIEPPSHTKLTGDMNECDVSPFKSPPLPPRKHPPPVPFIPPRHAAVLLSHPPPSLSNVSTRTAVSAPGPSSSKPVPPPPPKINHITSTLMRQSLQASKAAQSMKKAEEELERERVLRVLKSSSTSNVNTIGRTRSASPNKQLSGSSDGSNGKVLGTGPPLPSRRPHQMPSPPPSTASTTASAGSLGEVASASVGRGGRCRSASRERAHPFYAFGRSSPFATGGPVGSSDNNNGKPNAVLGSNSPFRSSPSSMMNSPSGSPSRNPVDLPPMPRSPLHGPPPMHPARRNSASTSHSHSYSYSHSHMQPQPQPQPDSFDSVYAPEIDLDKSSLGSMEDTGGAGPSSNQHQSQTNTPPNSDMSPLPRVSRSKSMHHASPVPILPPRRNRPESVQLTPTSPMGAGPFRGRTSPSPRRAHGESPFDTPLPQSPRFGSGLSRHASLSMPARRRDPSLDADLTHSAHIANASSSASSSAMTTFQRTLLKLDPQKLQPKLDALQPKLDKARYKAEAGLSRKGYVNHGTYGKGMWEEGEQGLIGNREDQDRGEDRYGHEMDVSEEEGEISGGLVGSGRVGGRRGEGRGDSKGLSDLDAADGLKWPAGEGWRPL